MTAHFQRIPTRQAVLGLVVLLLMAAFGLTESQSHLRAQDAKAEQNSATQTPDKSMQIVGVCKDEKGAPLKDVHVALYQQDHTLLSINRMKELKTDAEGRFALLGLPAPQPQGSITYAVTFTAKGRASFLWVGYQQKPSEKLAITLPQAAALRGRVTDTTGKPVAGAQVFTAGPSNEPLDGVLSARTDADGRYTIADLSAWDAANEKTVVTKHASFRTISRPVFVRHPDYGMRMASYTQVPSTVDVVLEPGSVIEGRVIDQVTGKPAAGVVVSTQGIVSPTETNWFQTRTDKEGKYRLISLSAASYNIWADAPDRACAAIKSFAVAAGKTYAAPDLELVKGGWIEGRIVDAQSGKPLTKDAESGAGLSVRLYGPSRPRPNGAACESAKVDDQGRFRFHVPPGYQSLMIREGVVWSRTERDNGDDPGDVFVKAGEVAHVVFRVRPETPVK